MDPTDPPSDEALFARFRAGDTHAFATLAARHERALLGLALGILNQNRDAAMDAVQDAWVRIIRSAHTFNGRSTLKTWLYRITINACKDARLRQGAQGFRHPLPEGGGGGEGSRFPSSQDHPTTDPDSPHHPDLSPALASLSPDRRLLLLLCYHRELTHPQAAEVFGIPLGTLKSRLNAALTDLRSRLREEAIK